MGRERGATLAEGALLVGLVALVVLGALTVLGRNSSDRLDEAARSTDTPAGDDGGAPSGSPPTPTAPPDVTVPGGSGGGDAGSGDPTGGDGPVTTTTPTTTTAAPLDDSFPTTTGFTVPTVETAGDAWRASADLVVRSSTGAPVPGATVTVDIRRRERVGGRWRWNTRTVVVDTGADGTVSVASLDWPVTGANRVSQVTFVVRDVDVDDWDGQQGTVSATP